MTLSFLYIDEQTNYHETLATAIADLPEVKMVHACNSIKAAGVFLKKNTVDFMLIDPNFTKENGFSFIEKHQSDHTVIILSSRIKHAVRGYDIGVFDFIQKPFDIQRFQKSIDRLKNQPYFQEKLSSKLPQSYLEVRCDLMTERILHEDIQFIEAMGDYVKIATKKRKFVVLISMKKMEQCLPTDLFFRCHKSYIVNTKKILHYTGKEIILKDIKVPLSRFRKGAFKSMIFNID